MDDKVFQLEIRDKHLNLSIPTTLAVKKWRCLTFESKHLAKKVKVLSHLNLSYNVKDKSEYKSLSNSRLQISNYKCQIWKWTSS